ncbi:hypothetical protein L596_015743 [Steinernema carpocapsae]|nr:hypothetical protein L596_015743 [Steinernema carpocapsae]
MLNEVKYFGKDLCYYTGQKIRKQYYRFYPQQGLWFSLRSQPDRPQQKLSQFLKLPVEVKSHIFSFLSQKEKLQSRLVCNVFNVIVIQSFPRLPNTLHLSYRHVGETDRSVLVISKPGRNACFQEKWVIKPTHFINLHSQIKIQSARYEPKFGNLRMLEELLTLPVCAEIKEFTGVVEENMKDVLKLAVFENSIQQVEIKTGNRRNVECITTWAISRDDLKKVILHYTGKDFTWVTEQAQHVIANNKSLTHFEFRTDGLEIPKFERMEAAIWHFITPPRIGCVRLPQVSKEEFLLLKDGMVAKFGKLVIYDPRRNAQALRLVISSSRYMTVVNSLEGLSFTGRLADGYFNGIDHGL